MSSSNKENTIGLSSAEENNNSFLIRNPNRQFFLRSASQIPKNFNNDISNNNNSINPSQKQRVAITQDKSDRSLQVAAQGIQSYPSSSKLSTLQPQQQPVNQQICSTGRKRIFEDNGIQGQSHMNNNNHFNHTSMKDKENIKIKENEKQTSLFFSSTSENQPKKSISSLRSPERISIEPICNNPIAEDQQPESDLCRYYQRMYEETQQALQEQQEQSKNMLTQQQNESLQKQQELVIKMQQLQQEKVGLVGQIKQKDIELGQLQNQVQEEKLSKQRLIDEREKNDLELQDKNKKNEVTNNLRQLEQLMNENKYQKDIITQGKQYIKKLEEDQMNSTEMYKQNIVVMRSDIDKLIISNQDVASKLEVERKEFIMKEEQKDRIIEELTKTLQEQMQKIAEMGRERSEGIVYIQKLQREIEELRKKEDMQIRMNQQQLSQQQQQFQQSFCVQQQQLQTGLQIGPSSQCIYQLSPQKQFTSEQAQPLQYQSQLQQRLLLNQDITEEQKQVNWNVSAGLGSEEVKQPWILNNYDNLTQITEEDAEDISQLGSSNHQQQGLFMNPHQNTNHQDFYNSTNSQFIMHPNNSSQQQQQQLQQQQQQGSYQIFPQQYLMHNAKPRLANNKNNVNTNSQDNTSFSSLLSPPQHIVQQQSSVYSPQSFNSTSPAAVVVGDTPSQVRTASVPRQSISLAKSNSVRSLGNNTNTDSNNQSDISSQNISKQQTNQQYPTAGVVPFNRISGYPIVSRNNNYSEQQYQQGQFQSQQNSQY